MSSNVDIESSGEAAFSGTYIVGDATAVAETNFNDVTILTGGTATQQLSVGETTTWTSHASGNADDGTATSIAFMDAFISLSNTNDLEEGTVTFSWHFEISATTSVDDPITESSWAEARVGFFYPGKGIFDLYAIVFDTVEPNMIQMSGHWDLTVQTGGIEISGFVVDASDDAAATPVPDPTTIILLGLGLFGIGAIRRRR